MEAKTTIKLNQPKELPAEGLTTVQSKPWKNHLVNFLTQDGDNRLFQLGGLYQKWTAASASPIQAMGRIVAILDKDIEDNMELLVSFLEGMLLTDTKKEDNATQLGQAKERLKKRLLPVRNCQLARMIQHIASFVYYTEQDNIDQDSKIWEYLELHNNIATKGASFLKITDLTFKSSMLHATFDKEYWAGFLDNLRKKGCSEWIRKPGAKLQEDEKLSPSFKDAIVLWTLKEIDPRLPAKVRKDYEYRFGNDTYLSDLYSTIFQVILSMLKDLDKQASIRSLTTQVYLDAFNPTVFPNGQRSRGGSTDT